MTSAINTAIATAKTIFPNLTKYTDDQIKEELKLIRKTTHFEWTNEALDKYTQATRYGQSFKIVGGRIARHAMYAALCEVESLRLKEIKESHQLAKNNSLLNKIEGACYYGADEDNA